MASQKTVLKVLRILLSKKYKDQRLIDGVLARISNRITVFEKEGKTLDLLVFDINAPSKLTRTISTVSKDKERER